MSAVQDSTTVDYFWSKVQKIDTPDACWNWAGSKCNGYGFWGKKQRRRLAHRFSYQLHHGEIPAGMCVCHRCDNPSCVNPSHLFLGTHEQNMYDKGRKGRGRGAKGVTNGAHKLTEDAVRTIRSKIAAGSATRTELAREFGVSTTTIRNIILRKQWVYLTD